MSYVLQSSVNCLTFFLEITLFNDWKILLLLIYFTVYKNYRLNKKKKNVQSFRCFLDQFYFNLILSRNSSSKIPVKLNSIPKLICIGKNRSTFTGTHRV